MRNWLRRVCGLAAAGAVAFCPMPARAEAASTATASAATTSAQAAPPAVQSASVIVADVDSGQIYYEKDMHAQMYPASITKILTGLVAAEHSQPADTVTVPQDVTAAQHSDMANIALLPGDTLKMEELQYALFVASANDAAIAIAEHVGGTMDGFLNMMNQKADELGAVDSHFSTPNGLPDPNNYTSAYDMALITQAAVQNQTVMQYFGTANYIIQPSGMRGKPVYLSAKHKMRQKGSRYYDKDVVAGKTGWETMSGNTLVTVAKRDGRTLVAVTLKGDSADTTFTDTRALLDYAFTQPADPAAPALPYLSIRQAKAAEAAASRAAAAQARQAREAAQAAARPAARTDWTESGAAYLPTLLAVTCVGAFFAVFALLVRRRMRGRTLD